MSASTVEKRYQLSAFQTTSHPFSMAEMVPRGQLQNRISQLFNKQQIPDHVEVSPWLSKSSPCKVSFKRSGLEFTAKVEALDLLSMVDIIRSLPGNTPESGYYFSFTAHRERDTQTPGRIIDYDKASIKMKTTVTLELSKIRAFIESQKQLAPSPEPFLVDLQISQNPLSGL